MESKYSAFPLAFKAVNKETGEELGSDKIEFSKHECYRCCNSVEVKPGDEVCPFCCRAPLSSISTEFSLVFWGWTPSEKVALLQQTGFTDAADQPVYFGDVLIDEHSRKPYIVQMNDDQICALIVDGLSDPVEVIYPQAGGFGCLFIIGNCYEPPSKWVERARLLFPDAQLPEPEGVRG